MTKDNIVAACGKTLYGKNEKKDAEFKMHILQAQKVVCSMQQSKGDGG